MLQRLNIQTYGENPTIEQKHLIISPILTQF